MPSPCCYRLSERKRKSDQQCTRSQHRCKSCYCQKCHGKSQGGGLISISHGRSGISLTKTPGQITSYPLCNTRFIGSFYDNPLTLFYLNLSDGSYSLKPCSVSPSKTHSIFVIFLPYLFNNIRFIGNVVIQLPVY